MLFRKLRNVAFVTVSALWCAAAILRSPSLSTLHRWLAQAQATDSAKTQQVTTAARLTTANAARDGVEGVDLDHE